MTVDISVVICTYNRAEMLRGALESLCRQAVSPTRFEILIVDNGSTDHTTQVINTIRSNYHQHRLRPIFESRQGLGISRNQALIHAHGAYIAYMDDDARATPHWLAYILNVIDKQREEITCLGGPIAPFYTSLKPVWFKDAYEVRSQGLERRKLRNGETLSGSNMIWHKEKLLSVGGFGENVGVKGQQLSLGEETGTFLRVWQECYDPLLLYVPELVMAHWVPDFKMKVSYRLKRAFVAGQVAVKLDNFQNGSVHTLLGAVKGILFGTVKALTRYRQYPFPQNWIIEEGQPILINLGTIFALLGIYIPVRQA